MSKIPAIITILLGILFAPISNADSTLEELDAANKAFAKALMAGDVDALVNDYTDAESAVHKNRFALVFIKVGGLWKLRVDSWNPQ
jgi:ketosteroid isomerase-like protein